MTSSSSQHVHPLSVVVLLQSPTSKLKGIATLLQFVVTKAKTVVKGSDSHKRFNLQYGEFCRAALNGVSQLEREINERLFEHAAAVANGADSGCDSQQQLGRSPSQSPTTKAKDVADQNKMREAIVAFVTHANKGSQNATTAQTPLTVQLSEEAFLSDVASYVSHECNNILSKILLQHLGGQSIAASQAAERQARDKVPAVGGKKRPRDSATVSNNNSAMDASMTMSPPHVALTSSPSLRPTPLVIPPSVNQKGSPALRPSQGGGAFPPAVKRLSDNPALAPLVQPWTIAQPYAYGVAIERVKDSSANIPFPSVLPTVFDICNASTAVDFQRLWEEREAVLSAGSQTGGESPVALRPLSATAAGAADATIPPVLGGSGPYFPSAVLAANRYCDAVPRSFLVQLVHCGVSSIEAARL